VAMNALAKSSAVGSTAKTVGTVPNNKKMISANKKSLFLGLITYPPGLGSTPSHREISMYARVRKISANHLMEIIYNNINMLCCPPCFDRSWLECHIWPPGKTVFGQMASCQNEDKDVHKVTRTRLKRCENLELFGVR
jgi:hypothetical protein